MRLATYNIEWFANLFDSRDNLLLDGEPSARHGVDRYTQGRAIAHVLRCFEDGLPDVAQAARRFGCQVGGRCFLWNRFGLSLPLPSRLVLKVVESRVLVVCHLPHVEHRNPSPLQLERDHVRMPAIRERLGHRH